MTFNQERLALHARYKAWKVGLVKTEDLSDDEVRLFKKYFGV